MGYVVYSREWFRAPISFFKVPSEEACFSLHLLYMQVAWEDHRPQLGVEFRSQKYYVQPGYFGCVLENIISIKKWVGMSLPLLQLESRISEFSQLRLRNCWEREWVLKVLNERWSLLINNISLLRSLKKAKALSLVICWESELERSPGPFVL